MDTAIATDEPDKPESADRGCYCCGAEKPEMELIRLSCHAEVGICFHCLSWLNRQRAAKRRDLLRLALPDWLPSFGRPR